MKRLFLIAVLALVLIFSVGCGKKAEAQPTPSPTPLVLITPEPTPSIEEQYNDTIAQNLHDGMGRYFEDLDGNGIPELFLGPTVGDIYEKQVINSMYTIIDGMPQMVFESKDNEKYYLCENGTVVLESNTNAYRSCNSFYSYANGMLTKMMSIGIDMKENPEMPWYKEEGETKTPLEENDAINALQAYRATYRNLSYS